MMENIIGHINSQECPTFNVNLSFASCMHTTRPDMPNMSSLTTQTSSPKTSYPFSLPTRARGVIGEVSREIFSLNNRETAHFAQVPTVHDNRLYHCSISCYIVITLYFTTLHECHFHDWMSLFNIPPPFTQSRYTNFHVHHHQQY